jgi:hypothetical protein
VSVSSEKGLADSGVCALRLGGAGGASRAVAGHVRHGLFRPHIEATDPCRSGQNVRGEPAGKRALWRSAQDGAKEIAATESVGVWVVVRDGG